MRLRVARTGGIGRSSAGTQLSPLNAELVGLSMLAGLLVFLLVLLATGGGSGLAAFAGFAVFAFVASQLSARVTYKLRKADPSSLLIEDKDGLSYLVGNGARRVTWISRKKLASSIELRMSLRRERGLRIDLGEDSPEFTEPGDPPLALWDYAERMPDVAAGDSASVYRQSHTASYVRGTQPVQIAYEARKHANVATTIVDESVIADERLFVREYDDVASMDLSLLRLERPVDNGAAEFIFGKSTRVVFVKPEGDAVVAALRERLSLLTETDEESRGEGVDLRRAR